MTNVFELTVLYTLCTLLDICHYSQLSTIITCFHAHREIYKGGSSAVDFQQHIKTQISLIRVRIKYELKNVIYTIEKQNHLISKHYKEFHKDIDQTESKIQFKAPFSNF